MKRETQRPKPVKAKAPIITNRAGFDDTWVGIAMLANDHRRHGAYYAIRDEATGKVVDGFSTKHYAKQLRNELNRVFGVGFQSKDKTRSRFSVCLGTDHPRRARTNG